MYRLLIVEDEKFVRNGIKDAISRLNINIGIIQTAENGLEALMIMQEKTPDIIISDVKMPKMDGLELARMVKENYTQVQFLLLSAYNDFDYAQEAIKYGVKAYLLKPLKDDILKETLDKVLNEIKDYNNDTHSLSNKVNSFESEKQAFLKKIIRGIKINEGLYSKAISRYNLPGLDSYVRAAVFNFKNVKNINLDKVLKKTNTYWDNMNTPAVSFFDYIIVFLNNISGIYKIEIEKKLDDYRKYIENETGSDTLINIGIGNLYKGIDNFEFSYNEAIYAISYRFLGKRSTATFYQDLQSNNYDDLNDETINNLIKKLISSVLSYKLNNIKNHVHVFFTIIIDKGKFLSDFVHIKCLEILFEIGYKIKERDLNVNIDRSRYISDIMEIKNIDDLMQWFEEILISLSSEINDSYYSDFISKTKMYVKENFMERITLEIVAEHVHINSAYLSSSFKKSTGKNFIDYVNEIRIGEAEKFLLKPDIRVKDIYYKIGYSNYSYFCRVFKKITGMSPLNYRYQKTLIGSVKLNK